MEFFFYNTNLYFLMNMGDDGGTPVKGRKFVQLLTWLKSVKRHGQLRLIIFYNF